MWGAVASLWSAPVSTESQEPTSSGQSKKKKSRSKKKKGTNPAKTTVIVQDEDESSSESEDDDDLLPFHVEKSLQQSKKKSSQSSQSSVSKTLNTVIVETDDSEKNNDPITLTIDEVLRKSAYEKSRVKSVVENMWNLGLQYDNVEAILEQLAMEDQTLQDADDDPYIISKSSSSVSANSNENIRSVSADSGSSTYEYDRFGGNSSIPAIHIVPIVISPTSKAASSIQTKEIPSSQKSQKKDGSDDSSKSPPITITPYHEATALFMQKPSSLAEQTASKSQNTNNSKLSIDAHPDHQCVSNRLKLAASKTDIMEAIGSLCSWASLVSDDSIQSNSSDSSLALRLAVGDMFFESEALLILLKNIFSVAIDRKDIIRPELKYALASLLTHVLPLSEGSAGAVADITQSLYSLLSYIYEHSNSHSSTNVSVNSMLDVLASRLDSSIRRTRQKALELQTYKFEKKNESNDEGSALSDTDAEIRAIEQKINQLFAKSGESVADADLKTKFMLRDLRRESLQLHQQAWEALKKSSHATINTQSTLSSTKLTEKSNSLVTPDESADKALAAVITLMNTASTTSPNAKDSPSQLAAYTSQLSELRHKHASLLQQASLVASEIAIIQEKIDQLKLAPTVHKSGSKAEPIYISASLKSTLDASLVVQKVRDIEIQFTGALGIPTNHGTDLKQNMQAALNDRVKASASSFGAYIEIEGHCLTALAKRLALVKLELVHQKQELSSYKSLSMPDMVAGYEESISKFSSDMEDDLKVIRHLEQDLCRELLKFTSSMQVGTAGSECVSIPIELLTIAINALKDADVKPSPELLSFLPKSNAILTPLSSIQETKAASSKKSNGMPSSTSNSIDRMKKSKASSDKAQSSGGNNSPVPPSSTTTKKIATAPINITATNVTAASSASSTIITANSKVPSSGSAAYVESATHIPSNGSSGSSNAATSSWKGWSKQPTESTSTTSGGSSTTSNDVGKAALKGNDEIKKEMDKSKDKASKAKEKDKKSKSKSRKDNASQEQGGEKVSVSEGVGVGSSESKLSGKTEVAYNWGPDGGLHESTTPDDKVGDGISVAASSSLDSMWSDVQEEALVEAKPHHSLSSPSIISHNTNSVTTSVREMEDGEVDEDT